MVQVDLTLQIQDCSSLPDREPKTGSPDAAVMMDCITELQWQQWFEQWLDALKPERSPLQSYEVSLLLTTDAEIQRLNATYRHQDRPTDVLAFAALEWEGPTVPAWVDLPINLGDIAISVETAADQATERDHTLKVELAWLACHGLLHLLGWDHPDAEQLTQMLTEQSRLLSRVGLEAPDWSPEDLGYVH